MNVIKIISYLFVAGALGGLTNSIVVWSLGALGITPALGFSMAPELTFEWVFRRVFASGLWGIIFLIPVYKNSPIKKGAVLSILPWLSSALIVFPMRMDVGYFGLGFGIGTPIWTLLFAAIWGVTGTLFLSKFVPGSESIKQADNSAPTGDRAA
ncbi:MAG: hypothetical protein GQ470_00665 [Gammaproteobacteria bacterium]|nr:hypothetical protein [Gammaproteobacteria bacterium]